MECWMKMSGTATIAGQEGGRKGVIISRPPGVYQCQSSHASFSTSQGLGGRFVYQLCAALSLTDRTTYCLEENETGRNQLRQAGSSCFSSLFQKGNL